MMAVHATLDRMEGRLARAAAWLRQPRHEALAVLALVLLAVAVRLPMVARSNDVLNGHNDAWIYFNYVWGHWLQGDVFPDAHRGSGWMLLLFVTLKAYGLGGGDWVSRDVALVGDEAQAILLAHTLSAMLGAGIVAATYLLARQLLGPLSRILALALLAIDPYLLFTSPSALSEPPYTVLLVLATAAVLKARSHPAWLLLAGALMALAHMLRINGVVMAFMLLLFAVLLLRGRTWAEHRRLAAWSGGAVAVFFLVAFPYLAWRAEHLPGPFDYGTNQRFWADELWDTGNPVGNTDDPYWSTYSPEGGGERETMGDYFRTHTFGDAVGRLYHSVQYQVFDLVGVGKWPATEREGGVWPGSPPDGAALTPLLVLLGAVACFRLRGRAWLFLPLALLFTFLTFVWIYPLVRSVRYFAPLIPLVAVAGVAGYASLAKTLRRPLLLALAVLSAYVLLYAGPVLVRTVDGAIVVLGDAEAASLVLLSTAAWVLLASAPWWARAPHRRGADAAGSAKSA